MPSVLVYVLFFLSGAAGLVYELIWVRELIFVFGGTTYAVTTVLVAFMAGLGLGSYLAGRWSAGLQRPQRVYGALEIAVGLYALAVPVLLAAAEPVYRGLYGHLGQTPGLLTLARFLLSVGVLIVPTTCMGATLPVLVRYVTLAGGAVGRTVGVLYGINTLGAVLGVLAAGFWLIPGCGLARTTWIAAAANIGIGAAALTLLRVRVGMAAQPVREARAARRGVPATREEARATAGARDRARPRELAPQGPAVRWAVLAGFAVSGFAAMVYQIAWTRALILSVGSSTYSFTCILAAFILGLAVGSLAVARWVDRWGQPARLFGVCELAIGVVATLIVPIHGRIPLAAHALVTQHAQHYSALLTWQFLLIIAVTFVPTFLMGAIFPLVTRALARASDEAGAATGRAYAVNTLGTIAGSLLAGFVLIRSEVLGVQNAIVLASILNGVVGAGLVLLTAEPTRRRRMAVRAGAALAAIPVVALVAGRWDPLLLNSAPYLGREQAWRSRREMQTLFVADGVDMTVAVLRAEKNPDALSLTVNGKPDASTAPGDMTTQLLLGHVPALLGAQNRTACVIGLGSGTTLSALARHASFERLDMVEIADEVIRAAALFAPYNYGVLTDDPRVRMIRADGRNHLLLTNQTYDVIVSEPSNPWISGVANLFTREFLGLTRARLQSDGVLAVWLHGYMMSQHDFQMIVRTLFEVYDSVSLWHLTEGDYLLVASPQPLRIALERFTARFEALPVRNDLYRIGLYRPAQILGRFIAADGRLREWAAGAPVHTDDNALLEFSAPRYLFAGEFGQLAASFLQMLMPVQAYLDTPDAAAREQISAEIERVVFGQTAYARGAHARPGEDPGPALRRLVEAFRADRSNLELSTAIDRARVALQAGGTNPAMRELAKLLSSVAPTLVTPPRGVALEDVAQKRRLRADTYRQAGDRAGEIEELAEALRLLPGDEATARALATAYQETGQPAAGAAVLAEWQRWQATSRPATSRP